VLSDVDGFHIFLLSDFNCFSKIIDGSIKTGDIQYKRSVDAPE